jgi:hypothetical protein
VVGHIHHTADSAGLIGELKSRSLKALFGEERLPFCFCLQDHCHLPFAVNSQFKHLFKLPKSQAIFSDLTSWVFCFIPLSIIMFRSTELRHKRLDGCRKKRLHTATFFDNPYKGVVPKQQLELKKVERLVQLRVSALSCLKGNELWKNIK